MGGEVLPEVGVRSSVEAGAALLHAVIMKMDNKTISL